jgi:hypothetical protein
VALWPLQIAGAFTVIDPTEFTFIVETAVDEQDPFAPVTV